MSRAVLETEVELTRRRAPYARVTVTWAQGLTSGKVGNQCVVDADGQMTGWIGGACSREQVLRHCHEALVEGRPRVLCLGEANLFALHTAGRVHEPITCASEGALELFIEPHLPQTQLVVIGDAPVAHALCRLGKAVGYDVVAVLLEDAERPEADTVIRSLDRQELAAAHVGPGSFVVVATMGQYDEDAVELALDSRPSYAALVASAKRAESVKALVKARGMCGKKLASLRAPAGLDLGAIPHAEIAVAVLAEIVQLKAQGVGRPQVTPLAKDDVVDPVCGMTVNLLSARYTHEHDGVKFGFCAAGCLDRFKADPESWLRAAG
jgi:xanthine dehydrogenase accessory factor